MQLYFFISTCWLYCLQDRGSVRDRKTGETQNRQHSCFSSWCCLAEYDPDRKLDVSDVEAPVKAINFSDNGGEAWKAPLDGGPAAVLIMCALLWQPGYNEAREIGIFNFVKPRPTFKSVNRQLHSLGVLKCFFSASIKGPISSASTAPQH